MIDKFYSDAGYWILDTGCWMLDAMSSKQYAVSLLVTTSLLRTAYRLLRPSTVNRQLIT